MCRVSAEHSNRKVAAPTFSFNPAEAVVDAPRRIGLVTRANPFITVIIGITPAGRQECIQEHAIILRVAYEVVEHYRYLLLGGMRPHGVREVIIKCLVEYGSVKGRVRVEAWLLHLPNVRFQNRV